MKDLYTDKSGIEGTGIFSNENICKGDHIAFIQGTIKKKIIKTRSDALTIPLWYGITESLWIDPGNTIWRYFNHSCEPNTAIVGTKKLIALKNIKAHTELVFDYSMTDGDILWEMECLCNHRNCRKKINSIQKIPEEAFQKHLPYIPKYFVQLRKKYLTSGKI